MSTIKDLSNITYTGVKSEIIDFIKTNPKFTDWNFEGSNISFLVSMLSYASYYSNVYNAFSINESFLDTAVLRENVVSHAKQQGYIPRSSSSAKMYIDISFDVDSMINDGVDVPDTITIKRYSKFTLKSFDNTFIFNTDRNYILYNTNNTLKYNNSKLIEGLVFEINSKFNISNTIELPQRTDVSTLNVYVNNEKWEYSKNAVTVNRYSKVFYIQENSDGNFEIYFGDDVLSKKPNDTDYINIVGLQSSESLANITNKDPIIEYTDNININGIDYSKYIILKINDLPTGGKEKEDIESIRKNAIGRIVSQDRAITILDYVNILESVFYESVNNAVAWDYFDLEQTNEETLDDLGTVYLSIKPQDFRNKEKLTPYEIDYIANELHKKYIIPGILLNFVDPLYVKINHNIDVYYNNIALNSTLDELKTLIKNNIINLYNEKITYFNKYLPISLIQSVIDKTDTSIISSSVTPSFYVTKEYQEGNELKIDIKLYNKLKESTITCDFLNIYDDNGVIKSDIGDIGTVDYDVGHIKFTIPSNNITEDGDIDINFGTINPYMKSTRNIIFIDSGVYNFNMING